MTRNVTGARDEEDIHSNIGSQCNNIHNPDHNTIPITVAIRVAMATTRSGQKNKNQKPFLWKEALPRQQA